MKHPRKLTIRKKREAVDDRLSREEMDDLPPDASLLPDPLEEHAREEFGIAADGASE